MLRRWLASNTPRDCSLASSSFLHGWEKKVELFQHLRTKGFRCIGTHYKPSLRASSRGHLPKAFHCSIATTFDDGSVLLTAEVGQPRPHLAHLFSFSPRRTDDLLTALLNFGKETLQFISQTSSPSQSTPFHTTIPFYWPHPLPDVCVAALPKIMIITAKVLLRMLRSKHVG